MSSTLQQRLHTAVRAVLDSYPGAWLVWCDPRGDWGPLLERVANDARLGGFSLVSVSDRTADETGSPRARAAIYGRIEAGDSFVLHVRARADNLGWLWAPALLAERIEARTLRELLTAWGWRPTSLTVSDDEVAILARQGLQQDPAAWGGGGLQPDPDLLLEVLAGGGTPAPDQGLLLDLTTEQLGLPALEVSDLPRWRTRALARLLVTQAHQAAPQLIGDGHELLTPVGQRRAALQVLERWRDSLRLSKGLPAAIIEADRLAALGGDVAAASTSDGPFLSLAAERAVFGAVCARLVHETGKDLLASLAALSDDLVRHAEGFWGDGCPHQQALPWGELLRLAQACALLLNASPPGAWAGTGEAITWYVTGGWQMDRVGDALLRDLVRPTPELLALITPLREAYRARWEDSLIRWSGVWAGAGCPLPALGTAGEWLLARLATPAPAAILVIDALRYDLGAALAALLNAREGTERATVTPARAPLPSITALGMGFALPIAEAKLTAALDDGKWQLRVMGHEANLTVAAQRRAWLQQERHVPEDALLALAAIQDGTIPPPEKRRPLLVITDDLIDKLGHDDELEMLGGHLALERYARAVERLRDAGWRRVLIVTDHGYLHRASAVEHAAPPPAPDPAYKSRRALAYPATTTLAGPQGLAPGGHWCVAVPSGAASFKAYGGLGYFHGGASLQEWIIPCVQVAWPTKARPVGVAIQALPQILGLRQRVTLIVERPSLLIEDALPRQVEVLIRHASAHSILFRSSAIVLTPDQRQVDVALRVSEGIVAERGTSVRLEVRDTSTDEIIATGESTLMVELTGW